MKELLIGIVGTGSIASRFARACHMVEGVTPAAVSSRSEERGRLFAAENGIQEAFTGEEAMLASGKVDLVYVATPHPIHFEAVLLALRAGKPVLCEKPMALSGKQAEALFAEAERQHVFLMEGMWSRFLPCSRKALSWIREGRIGRVRMIDGAFTFTVDRQHPKPRLVRPELGGGAMFDVGVYTLEMASFYAGCNPESFSGYCEPFCPGTDGTSVLALRYPNGVLATLRMGIDCEAETYMKIYGEKGRIEIPRFFSAPQARLFEDGVLAETVSEDCELPKGFTWQIAAVRDDLSAGRLQNALVPKETTIACNRILGEMMASFFPDRYGNS